MTTEERDLKKKFVRTSLMLRGVQFPDPKRIIFSMRKSVENKWKNEKPVHTTEPVEETPDHLRAIIERHFGPGATFLYLGPFAGKWREALERAGARTIGLDASRKYLRRPRDPYRSIRLVWKDDLHDIFPLGVGRLIYRKLPRATYEFTPCLYAPTHCIAEAASSGGLLYITSLPFLEPIQEALKSAGANYKAYKVPAVYGKDVMALLPPATTFVFVVPRTGNEHLARAWKAMEYLYSASPYTTSKGYKREAELVFNRTLGKLGGEYRDKVKKILDTLLDEAINLLELYRRQ